MVKYRLSPFFSVEAGPQVGFNVYNKIKIDGVDGNLGLDRVSHTVDLGLGAGATYYLTDYVMFHVRYNAWTSSTPTSISMTKTAISKSEPPTASNSNHHTPTINQSTASR